MIVLDSSAALDYLLGARTQAAWVESQLDDARWNAHVPHAIDIEVITVLRRRVLRGAISARRAMGLLELFAGFPLTRYPQLQLLHRMWELRTHVTPPDAAFVALAEALGVPLVTTDLRLSRTHGHRATILTP